MDRGILQRDVALLPRIDGDVVQVPGRVEPIGVGSGAGFSGPMGVQGPLGPVGTVGCQEFGNRHAIQRLMGMVGDIAQSCQRGEDVNGALDLGNAFPA